MQSMRVAPVLLLAGCAFLSACAGTTTTSDSRTVAAILVTPDQPVVDVGHTLQLDARPVDASGAELIGRRVTWSVPVGALLSISSSGRVTGIASGLDTIFAHSESVTKPVVIEVAPNPPTSLEFNIDRITLAHNQSQDLTVTARNRFGELVTGIPVVWVSDNPSIATVTSSGRVTAFFPGHTTIDAHYGPLRDSVVVDVVPNPADPSGTISLSGGYMWPSLYVGPESRILAGTLELTVNGPVTLIGPITSTGCTHISIVSTSTVTITAPITIPCGLHIVAAGGLKVLGTTIQTRGSQFYSNDPTLTDASFASAPTTSDATACEFTNVAATVLGRASGQGWNVDVLCRGDIAMNGPVQLRAGDAGPGPLGPFRAGTLRVRSTRDIVVANGVTTLGSGHASGGVSAVGTGVVDAFGDGLPVTFTSQNGGDVGEAAIGKEPIVLRAARDIRVTSAQFVLQVGNAGPGGNATAQGNAGTAADNARRAGRGGNATAFGGRGGNVYAPQVIAGGVIMGNIDISSGSAGTGGDATAVGGNGGNGGNGSDAFPDGGRGGDAFAFGGAGGQTFVLTTFLQQPARGGTGGAAVLRGGIGGTGSSGCASSGSKTGGRGGAGGNINGTPGTPGMGEAPGFPSFYSVESASNGGAGGAGTPPGAGGSPGIDLSPNQALRVLLGTAFLAGTPGVVCTP